MFSPLSEESYAKIAALMLEELRSPLKEKNLELNISNGVCAAIARKAYGGKFGGRDIRKVIRTDVEDALANAIIDNADSGAATVNITAENGEIRVELK